MDTRAFVGGAKAKGQGRSGKIQREEKKRGAERRGWSGGAEEREGERRGCGKERAGVSPRVGEGGGNQRALRVDPRAESSIKLNNISVRSLAKKRTAAHGRPTAAGQGWLASQPFPTSVWPQTNFKRV